MLCEVEFLPVGESSRAGDAIVVRYGEINNFKLILIDGGTAETGEMIVSHLKNQFGPNVRLEHIILTHSDTDHASGLREVLRKIPVANVWLHIPWLLAKEAMILFKNKNWTAQNLSAAIKREYDIISEIVELAISANCKLFYPFQGEQIGPFTVLSPRKNTYLHLLPQFDKTPEPDQQLIELANLWLGKASNNVSPLMDPVNVLAALLEKAATTVKNWMEENWGTERLRDGGVTSASNESSVILYANLGEGRRILLTGDAGINALSWAANYAKSCGFPLQTFSCVQIPHHGSRRNIGPSILNELVGPIQTQGTKRFLAYVSAPVEDDRHPRKIVINAFRRRGGEVLATQGTSKVFLGGFPLRPGYGAVEGLPFYTKVEAYD